MHAAILAFFDAPPTGTAPCSVACTVMDWWDTGRIAIAAIVAGQLIWSAYKTMIGKVEEKKRTLGHYVIFNAVAFSILGAAVVIMATKQWPTVLLAVGACMAVGFLVGLLFGYPMSSPAPNPAPTAGAAANSQSQAKNLLQQSVDVLSKLVAGATLVQAGPIYGEFKKVAHALSQYSFVGGIGCDSGGYVFGAGVTLYFLLLGFLSALLLANTYHLITPPEVPLNGQGGLNGNG